MTYTEATYDTKVKRYRGISGRFVSVAAVVDSLIPAASEVSWRVAAEFAHLMLETVTRMVFDLMVPAVGQLIVAENAPRVRRILHAHPDGPIRCGPTPAAALRARRVAAWGF